MALLEDWHLCLLLDLLSLAKGKSTCTCTYLAHGVDLARHTCIIGASLSEPHINGTAMRKLYIMVRRSREIYAQHNSMDISAKYSIAHSHALVHRPYIRCSNLTNCRFTLVQQNMK